MKSNTSTLKYCGIQSNMACYSQQKYINIALSVIVYLFYNIKLSFSVIDSNKIISVSIKKIKLIQACELQRYEHVEVFYLSVENFKQMIIHFYGNKSAIVVYDGPGTFSRILIPMNLMKHNNTYLASSFQCVIYKCEFHSRNRFQKKDYVLLSTI